LKLGVIGLRRQSSHYVTRNYLCCLVLLTAGIEIRRSQFVILTEGDLRVSGTETFQIIAESMGNRLGLVLNCEVVMI